MGWQLRDPELRRAIRAVIDAVDGRCALAGTVGAQIHLASVVGRDKLGPPARAIEVVVLGEKQPPAEIGGIPVAKVDALGFEASVEASRSVVEIAGEPFVVASPEHILGMALAAPEVFADTKWACFVLMRTFEGRLDLEVARGLLKRCPHEDRQSLLAELAYLAA
jgi:hypothetical protein